MTFVLTKQWRYGAFGNLWLCAGVLFGLVMSLGLPVDAGEPWRVRPLAQDHVTVYRSEHPAELFTGSPSIVALPTGRLVASLDQFGPGVGKYCTGPIGARYHFGHKLQGLIYTSDDAGLTWTLRAKFPFCHARLFLAGDTLYLLGHKGNIMIMSSANDGTTWSEPVSLTEHSDEGGRYTQAPANVLFAAGHVQLIMMYITDFDYRGYFVSTLALVALRAPADQDLCNRANWTLSAPSKPFRELVPTGALDYFGIPMPLSRNDPLLLSKKNHCLERKNACRIRSDCYLQVAVIAQIAAVGSRPS
jgi:hypothetical protein